MPVFSARDILGEANVVQANLPAFVSKESVAVNGFESKLASAHAGDELQGAGDQEDPNISSKLFDLQICGKVKQNLSGVWERA
ncbi:hypothetical protein HOD08_04680 [bacterium]|nr:hypothetical protein [bacterium]